ncbi:MAG: hypothetical protein U0903_09250 [Planctomycetales bacterium]
MRAALPLVALLILTALQGCNRGKGRITTYRVQGKVLLNGQPPIGANIALFPVGFSPAKPALNEAAAKLMQSSQKSEASPEAAKGTQPFPTGVVESDGSFQLSTYRAKDGSPVGEYVVVLSLRKPLNPNASDPDYGPEEFPEAYTRPETSPLKVEIKGRSTLGPFEINKTGAPQEKNS